MDVTPFRALSGYLFPNNTNTSALPAHYTSIMLAQLGFLSTAENLQQQLHSQHVALGRM